MELEEALVRHSAATNGRLINLMGLLLFLVLAVVVDRQYFWVCLAPIAAVGFGYLADVFCNNWAALASVCLSVVPYAALFWLGVGL